MKSSLIELILVGEGNAPAGNLKAQALTCSLIEHRPQGFCKNTATLNSNPLDYRGNIVWISSEFNKAFLKQVTFLEKPPTTQDSNTVMLRMPYSQRKIPHSRMGFSSALSSHPCWWFFSKKSNHGGRRAGGWPSDMRVSSSGMASESLASLASHSELAHIPLGGE